jgi:hypothetical protein
MKFSKFISYFFHPINFSIIGIFLYFILIPRYIFKPQEHIILIVVFLGTYVFPLLLMFLLKQFKMINSFEIANVEERKFPTLLFISISFIIGNWLYKSTIVDLLSLFYFGYGFALIISYVLLYLKVKISLHTTAIGGLIGFLIYFSYYYKINLIYFFIILFALSGIIAFARLKMKAHSFKEIFLGYIIGIFSQLITFAIYSM